MATLLDTSALAVLIRRRDSPYESVAQAARSEIVAGQALLSVISAAELLVGARDVAGAAHLERLIESLTVVPVDRELAGLAGRLGAYVRRHGAILPLPDLLVAATAVRLRIPLLTTDSDFARGRDIASADRNPDPSAGLWRSLQIHAAGGFV